MLDLPFTRDRDKEEPYIQMPPLLLDTKSIPLPIQGAS
jgi:hypothetical protein